MAEYIPPPKTLFSVKIVNGQFVVDSYEDSVNTVTQDRRDLYHAYLNNFCSALAFVNENEYNKDVISQLLLSNTHLSLCLQNRRIEELELSLAPLRHQLAAYEYILGTETTGTDEHNQQATDNSPGMTWVSLIKK